MYMPRPNPRLVSSRLIVAHGESYMIPGPESLHALQSRDGYYKYMYTYNTRLLPVYARIAWGQFWDPVYGVRVCRRSPSRDGRSNTGTGCTRTAVEIGRSSTAQRSRSPRLAGRVSWAGIKSCLYRYRHRYLRLQLPLPCRYRRPRMKLMAVATEALVDGIRYRLSGFGEPATPFDGLDGAS